jgi:Cytochrome c7 and related cytochrome c
MRIAFVVSLIAIVAGIGGATVVDRDAWSPIVYPAQRLPLIFSHQQHLRRGATCATCHPGATTSRSAVDNLIPTEAACRACHPIDRAEPERVVAGAPVAACRGCHLGWAPDKPVERVYLTPTPLKFDHSAHVATPCKDCHGDFIAERVDLATTRQLPTMDSCLRCHRDGSDERHCADCHLAKLGGLIETKLAHGDLVPQRFEGHGAGFARDHKQQAREVGATCTACHNRSECIDCHQGVVKPMDFHPGNYLLSHAIDARRGRPDCSACHRYETFCVACHERSGIGNRAGGQFSAIDPNKAFHVANWASRGPGPNLHAGEARRNITSCASCHRDEDCMDCHSAEPGKLHASPHPTGWRGSARCRALDRGNRRMCLRCHTTQNELGCDWKAP